MSIQDWKDQAVKAFRAAASSPGFPGDPDPLEGLFDKLVAKLYGECHNGGVLGFDGCPPCRAFQVEELIKQLKAEKDKSYELSERLYESEKSVSVLASVEKESAKKLSEAVGSLAGLERQYAEKVEQVRGLHDQLHEAVEHRDNLATEVYRLRSAVNEMNEELAAFRLQKEAYKKLVAKLGEL